MLMVFSMISFLLISHLYLFCSMVLIFKFKKSFIHFLRPMPILIFMHDYLLHYSFLDLILSYSYLCYINLEAIVLRPFYWISFIFPFYSFLNAIEILIVNALIAALPCYFHIQHNILKQ